MNVRRIVIAIAAFAGAGYLVLLFSSRAESQVTKALVVLQPVTPGVAQTGHAHVTGTIRAGQFVGGGAGVTSVNATLLDGLDSTAFLQSVPIPLTLSGSSSTYIISGENAATNALSKGILGSSTATSGQTYGVWGESYSTTGRGVFGYARATSGNTYGLSGLSLSTSGYGVYGHAGASSGITYGGFFESDSDSGSGVLGRVTRTSGTSYGGYFSSSSSSGTGVYGLASNSSGTTYGVSGRSDGEYGRGVYGRATTESGLTYGVYGQSDSIGGRGVFGISMAGSGQSYGVEGFTASSSGRGINGYAASLSGTTYGGYFESVSSSGYGVYGKGGSYGVRGYGTESASTSYGGYFQGSSQTGAGIFAWASNLDGGASGVIGYGDGEIGIGVFGQARNGTTNFTTYGGYFVSNADSGIGAYGFGDHYGLYGRQGSFAAGSYGVYANADLGASGYKSFRIDHPFDPKNRYLLHYSTESPTPQNFYSGNVVTDGSGYAWVRLPDYFEAINTDYKYQLTVIGKDFAQAIVSEEISGNRFQIRTNVPRIKVSWRVEAERHDLYAREHPARDVLEKSGEERGKYQMPELYGITDKSQEMYPRREE